MNKKLRSLIDEIDSNEHSAPELRRWQYQVEMYLEHIYGNEILKKFNDCVDADDAFSNIWDSVAKQKGYLEAVLMKNILKEQKNQKTEESTNILPKDLETLISILTKKTSKSILPLQRRRANSQTLNFNNEYDYQDYLHSMLIPWVKDIRPEEYSPSYAGTSKRVDFLLKEHDTFVEVKYVRDKGHAKKIGDEITIDIHHYQAHPHCKYLYAIIYDPNKHMMNPKGFEMDLSKEYISGTNHLAVKVYIVS